MEKIYQQNKLDSTLSDVTVINAMIRENDSAFYPLPFKTWFDIGNIKALQCTRDNIKNGNSLAVLDKIDESIFIFDDFHLGGFTRNWL